MFFKCKKQKNYGWRMDKKRLLQNFMKTSFSAFNAEKDESSYRANDPGYSFATALFEFPKLTLEETTK